MLQRVRHLLAADELGPGDDAPEVSAGSMIAVLVGGEDVLDPLRIEPNGFHGRPFALERQPRVPFDEDEAIGGFDDALPAEIAFYAAAGDLPDALLDRGGAGVGGPWLERFADGFVEVGLP